jgi:hypothetical protein
MVPTSASAATVPFGRRTIADALMSVTRQLDARAVLANAYVTVERDVSARLTSAKRLRLTTILALSGRSVGKFLHKVRDQLVEQRLLRDGDANHPQRLGNRVIVGEAVPRWT